MLSKGPIKRGRVLYTPLNPWLENLSSNFMCMTTFLFGNFFVTINQMNGVIKIVLIILCVVAIYFVVRSRSSVRCSSGVTFDLSTGTYYTQFEFHRFRVRDPTNNAAWVTSCNRDYFSGVLKLYKSMQKVGSKFPLVCLCTDSTTSSQELELKAKGIETIRVSVASISNPYDKKWTEAFVKLECWKLVKYAKVCWIDSDIIQLKNGDELMGIPLADHGIACAVDHETFAPPGERVWFRMFQSGLFVLKPSLATYNRLKANLGVVTSADGSDQGFLTSFYATLDFHSVVFLSSAYNYGKRGMRRHKKYDIKKIKNLHFVGHPKPWKGGESGYEKLQAIWDQI